MSTRFHDDESRIKKQTEMSSFQCKYFMNTPGQGLNLPYCEDTHLRLQKWGGNLQTNTVNLESDFRGLTRKLNRDNIEKNNYNNHKIISNKVDYSTSDPFTEQSNATHPKWMYRSFNPDRWEQPIFNPQENLEKGFHDNIQTRILEKDNFVSQKNRNF